MRNLRWSKRLWGRTPPSCASVGRQDREGKHIEERTDRNRGLHSKLGKKSCSKLLRDNLVSVAPGVCALYVGVILVDGDVIRRCPPQRNVAVEIYRRHAANLTRVAP